MYIFFFRQFRLLASNLFSRQNSKQERMITDSGEIKGKKCKIYSSVYYCLLMGIND